MAKSGLSLNLETEKALAGLYGRFEHSNRDFCEIGKKFDVWKILWEKHWRLESWRMSLCVL